MKKDLLFLAAENFDYAQSAFYVLAAS